MNRTFRTWMAGAGALAVAAALAPSAWAGCAAPLEKRTALLGAPDQGLGRLLLAAFETPVGSPIVGMWSVTFYDSSQHVVDFGYVQWHSDGTEIMNSGGRSPASENFCLGIWGQLGQREYALNHWALSYDPATGKMNAKVNIKEDVILGPTNNSYSGPFVMSVFDPQTGKQLQQIRGRVIGQRITL